MRLLEIVAEKSEPIDGDSRRAARDEIDKQWPADNLTKLERDIALTFYERSLCPIGGKPLGLGPLNVHALAGASRVPLHTVRRIVRRLIAKGELVPCGEAARVGPTGVIREIYAVESILVHDALSEQFERLRGAT